MFLNHDELMVLSRGGRVPRAERPVPAAMLSRNRGTGMLSAQTGAGLHRPRRLAGSLAERTRAAWRLVRGRPRASRAARGELGAHAYLELEFIVKDKR
jgi:hypothetical protein